MKLHYVCMKIKLSIFPGHDPQENASSGSDLLFATLDHFITPNNIKCILNYLIFKLFLQTTVNKSPQDAALKSFSHKGQS